MRTRTGESLSNKLAIGTIAAILLITTACNEGKGESTRPSSSVSAPATAPSTPTPVRETTITATGPIVVENQVDVAALREGVVSKIFSDTGQSVQKGQLLAQLDDRQVSADLEAAAAKVRAITANLKNWEAETKVLQADRERAEKMWDAQLITKQDLDHIVYKQEADVYEVARERESLNSAIATQQSLELEKEKTRVVAPFSGVVARRYAREGQKLALGERIFWISATSPLRVKFTLPEKYVNKVSVGEKLRVAAAEDPGSDYPARIVQVSPVVDPSSGTIEFLGELTGPAPALRPGMLASIHIDLHP